MAPFVVFGAHLYRESWVRHWFIIWFLHKTKLLIQWKKDVMPAFLKEVKKMMITKKLDLSFVSIEVLEQF